MNLKDAINTLEATTAEMVAADNSGDLARDIAANTAIIRYFRRPILTRDCLCVLVFLLAVSLAVILTVAGVAVGIFGQSDYAAVLLFAAAVNLALAIVLEWRLR